MTASKLASLTLAATLAGAPTLPGCQWATWDDCDSGDCTSAADDDTTISDDDATPQEHDCTYYNYLASQTCASHGLVLASFECSLTPGGGITFSYTCGVDTDADGTGDTYIDIDVTVVVEGDTTTTTNNNTNTTTTGDDDDSADDDTASDDDTSSGDDDTAVDEIGAYGCQHSYESAVEEWFTENWIPEALMCNGDLPCDADADGTLDAWTTVVYVEPGYTLEFDELPLLQLSGWYCTSWGDLTPDNTSDEGDSYSENAGDCDDRSSGNKPGATEVCGDGFDNDCDGVVDESCAQDDDGDSYSEFAGDCNDLAASIHPGAVEYCNGVDDDCDGIMDEADADGDGYVSDDCSHYEGPLPSDDCNDVDAAIHPGADEVTNWVDDDCDGTPDDGCTDENYQSYYDGGSVTPVMCGP